MMVDDNLYCLTLLNERFQTSQSLGLIGIKDNDNVSLKNQTVMMFRRELNEVTGFIHPAIILRCCIMVLNDNIFPELPKPACKRKFRAKSVSVGVNVCSQDEFVRLFNDWDY